MPASQDETAVAHQRRRCVCERFSAAIPATAPLVGTSGRGDILPPGADSHHVRHRALCHPSAIWYICHNRSLYPWGEALPEEELWQIHNPAGRPRFTRTRRVGSP
jgi:hypothetical protein